MAAILRFPAKASIFLRVANAVPGVSVLCNYRKNQVKKVVCHVPADGSSSDVWAWRKYGQKPIKGSPYPRSVNMNPFCASFT
jgi:hypothetical protein